MLRKLVLASKEQCLFIIDVLESPEIQSASISGLRVVRGGEWSGDAIRMRGESQAGQNSIAKKRRNRD